MFKKRKNDLVHFGYDFDKKWRKDSIRFHILFWSIAILGTLSTAAMILLLLYGIAEGKITEEHLEIIGSLIGDN